MRITIGNFVLCGGQTDDQYPEGVTLEGARVIQIAQRLRAASARPIDRGNKTVQVSFQVTREHETHRAACEYAIQHDTELPSSGLVAFQLEEPTGSSIVYLINGRLQRHVVSPIIGVSTVHAYTLVGGGWTSKKEEAVTQ
jgi:hypothetical protein